MIDRLRRFIASYFRCPEFQPGDVVTIFGETGTPTLFNGDFTIISVSPTGFTVRPSLVPLPTTMVYASVAKGVIAGFFNGTTDAAAGGKAVPLELQNYRPSSNITYEAGLKANWLDRRLQANMAVYYITYKDLQITAAPPAPRPMT